MTAATAPDVSENARSPTGRQRTRKGRTVRRAELLACAIKAFAAKGLKRASHSNVAELTDVTLPAVFAYFPTREALVEAVLDDVAAFWYGGVFAHTRDDAHPDPRISLYRSIVALAEAFLREPDYAALWLEWSTCINESFWPRYLDFLESDIVAYRDVINRGKQAGLVNPQLDSDNAARLIVSQAQMVATMLRSGMTVADVQGFIRFYVNAAIDCAGGN